MSSCQQGPAKLRDSIQIRIAAAPILFDSEMMGQFENFQIGRACPLLVVVSDTPIPSASLPQCIHVTNQQTSEPTSQVSTNHVVIVISDSVSMNTALQR